MKAWAKTIISLTLICYVVVSSVAAAHAFPPSLETTETSQASLNTFLLEMGPNCHQQQMGDVQPKTVSACKIFCAAMSNVIVDNIDTHLSLNEVGTEIVFLIKDVSKLTLDIEPHPPK